jgi:hypothetical protein
VPPSAYPSLSTIRPLYFEELPPEYPVTKSPPFADGGCDFNLDADQKVRRWRIDYDLLSEADAATLDAHVDSAKYAGDAGSAYGFSFTTRSGEALSNVRYDRGGYQRSDPKTWACTRNVTLVKYP